MATSPRVPYSSNRCGRNWHSGDHKYPSFTINIRRDVGAAIGLVSSVLGCAASYLVTAAEFGGWFWVIVIPIVLVATVAGIVIGCICSE